MRTLPIVLLLALFTGHAVSQEEPSADDMMKLMMKYGTPGKQHKAMEYFLGEWDVVSTMKMPGQEMKSKATARFEWLMQGRWMSQRLEGSMMGMPYEGFGVTGYDNYRNQHLNFYVSSIETAMHVTRGVPVDPTGKVTATYGELDEPTMKQVGKPYRVVTRRKDQDHFEMEIWDLGIGATGMIVVHYDYTRKK